MRKVRDPRAEAEAWFERLGHAISHDNLRQFFSWRETPAHDAAYLDVERDRFRVRGRFVVTPDAAGHSVIDTWTGEPAMFANVQMTGVSAADAEAVREILNRRSGAMDRRRQA